mgnify:CR=1 FL=1
MLKLGFAPNIGFKRYSSGEIRLTDKMLSFFCLKDDIVEFYFLSLRAVAVAEKVGGLLSYQKG